MIRILLTALFLTIAATPADAQDAVALRNQALELFAGNAIDKAKAMGLLEQAAAAGDEISMSYLGDFYLAGNGVTANRETAIAWYVKAVEAGHTASATKLAELAAVGAPTAETAPPPDETALEALYVNAYATYTQAETTEEELVKARATFREAASLGHLDAGFFLAYMLRRGEGGPRDYKESLALFERSADAGDGYAMMRIGEDYVHGLGVYRDLNTALEWYNDALETGQVDDMAERIAEIEAALAGPTPPAETSPPSDRWGAYNRGGQYAVGLRNDRGEIAFVCDQGKLAFWYAPAQTEYLKEHGNIPGSLLFQQQNGPKAWIDGITINTNYWISGQDFVEEWANRASRASEMFVGIVETPDAAEFTLHDSGEFTGKGSTAAIKQLRSVCKS